MINVIGENIIKANIVGGGTPISANIVQSTTSIKTNPLTYGYATETKAGIIRIATDEEAILGTLDNVAITPYTLTNGLNLKQNVINDLSTIRINAQKGNLAYNTLSGYGTVVTYNVEDFATSSQGSLADTSLQPNDNISKLINNVGYITTSDLPTKLSNFTDDLGSNPIHTHSQYLTEHQDISGKANISDLSNVAFSGDYDDLIDKPTIPIVNNAKLTIQRNGTTVKSFTANASSNVTCNISVPTDTNDLTNGAGYITGINSTDVTTALGFTPYDSSNPSGYITSASLPTLEDLTTTEQLSAINSGATSTNIGQIATNTSAISTIDGKIPSAATTTNQLADKNFVNSSIATNTANFIGTFNSVSDLEAYSGTLTNNDYAFVVTTDTAGNTLYDRYKYTTATTPASWQFEYELNNSSFTADQWAAINSGITTNGVSLINSAVQPSDLSTVATTGSYSDLTSTPTFSTGLTDTSGTITVTDYSKLLKNTATGSNALTINGTATTKTYAVNMGKSSEASGAYGTALGGGAYANATYTVAVGYCARVTATSSIQLGYGTTTTTNQLYVGFYNASKNWNLLDGTTGLIPDARISSNIARTSAIPTDTNDLTNGAGFITGITSSDVTTALGYTPYNSTNPDGYITSSAIANMQTTTNLVTSVSSSSTDSQYPSAKLFYDTCGDIETLINAL